jgi:hypothetical protein
MLIEIILNEITYYEGINKYRVFYSIDRIEYFQINVFIYKNMFTNKLYNLTKEDILYYKYYN